MKVLNLKFKSKTIEEKIYTLNKQSVVKASGAFFCILCEIEIEAGEEYLDSGHFCKAHKKCVDIAMVQIEESGKFVGLEGIEI